MKILVTGGRDYYNYPHLFEVLEEYEWHGAPLQLVFGDAKGADYLTKCFALVEHIPYQEFKANWSKYGAAAGPIRNQKMLDDAKPNLVLAFKGGKGTADMIARAKEAGVEVREIEDI